ncbi:MAG: murein transglycosylase A [Methyloceanibacter sp.]
MALGLAPVSFAALDGWAEDDHAAAFRAFVRSCRKAGATDPAGAVAMALGSVTRETARVFFESHFTLHAIDTAGEPGFVTGYYEPEVQGAREQDEQFSVPVYGCPAGLIELTPDHLRAQFNDRVTAMRESGAERVPYFTRAEIDAGALAGRELELLYLDDPVELFYMQVQGSGLVRLCDGSSVRVAYVCKNGHPYTSIGRLLIERGELPADGIDMTAVKAWLHADPARGRRLMAENKSYVFFRLLDEDEGRDGPLGAQGAALTPGRSLAVDAAYHRLGLPVFVTAPGLATPEGAPFRRLMVAQDVGSAIRGPMRGDIFWGSGDAAGAIAGRTRHEARFHVFVPKH